MLENLAAIFGGNLVAEDGKERIRDAAREERGTRGGARFFVRCAREVPRPERQAMIDRGSEVAVKRQAELLDLSRSTICDCSVEAATETAPKITVNRMNDIR